jgi:hypothetical protein
MKTEYAIGNMRIHFESRARRRWFVAFFYSVLAVYVLAGFSVSAKNATSTWVSVACMILFVALCLVFTWIAGNMRAHGDEREMYRRDHAHFRAYRFFLFVVMGALFFAPFRESNPLAPPMPLVLRGVLVQPNFVAMSAFLLYLTLPQAILLWTEPDMEKAQ